MINLGKKIKELRIKNNMTQEQLADLLFISYQSVSKWETENGNPDLTMIIPLARLFNITTDELLGVTNGDARRAEFDEFYENYWQKDHHKMYEVAKQAVFEFPGDYKYLDWLASCEYYVAFDEKENSKYEALLLESAKHYKIVIENVLDTRLKESAIYGLILDYKYLAYSNEKYKGLLDEARTFANMFPIESRNTKDEIYDLFVVGKESLTTKQRIIFMKLWELLRAFMSSFEFTDYDITYVKEFLRIGESVLNIFNDDCHSLLNFYRYKILLKKAELSVIDKKYEDAINYLKDSKECAIKEDERIKNRKQDFKLTSKLPNINLDDYFHMSEEIENDATNYWKYAINKKVFDPLKELEEYKKLIQ